MELAVTVVAWNCGIICNSSSKDYRDLPLDHFISKSFQLVKLLKHELRKGKLKFDIIIDSWSNLPKRGCNISSVKFSAPLMYLDPALSFDKLCTILKETFLSVIIRLLNSSVPKLHPNVSSWSLVIWFFWFDTLNCAWERSFSGFNPRFAFHCKEMVLSYEMGPANSSNFLSSSRLQKFLF